MTSATFVTSKGSFTVRLMPDHAPKTVANFVALATGGREWTDPRDGSRSTGPLYDGTIFHRVIEGFMIQGGDPTGTGTGGPGYTIPDEVNSHKHSEGALAMAKTAAPNTAGSQFYITLAPQPSLDLDYTVFGRVVDGMDVVKQIRARDPQRDRAPGEQIVSIVIEES